MKNMEQIRARNALKATMDTNFKGEEDGEVAKKVPTYIRDNGLLATMAFALDKKPGIKKVLDSVARHLSDPDIGRLPKDIDKTETWIAFLTEEASSSQLRDQTVEALAYLSYFRRFAKKGKAEQ